MLSRECSIVCLLYLCFVQNGCEVKQGEGFSHTSFASRLVALALVAVLFSKNKPVNCVLLRQLFSASEVSAKPSVCHTKSILSFTAFKRATKSIKCVQ